MIQGVRGASARKRGRHLRDSSNPLFDESARNGLFRDAAGSPTDSPARFLTTWRGEVREKAVRTRHGQLSAPFLE